MVIKKALIIGAARSGVAAAKLALAQGYQVVLTDQAKLENKQELENLGVIVYDQGFASTLLTQSFDVVIKNPGIPQTDPFVVAINHKHDIINEIEFASLIAPDIQIGAITGTNGKTTTTTLLGLMLQAQFDHAFMAGNIGTPLSTIVLEHPSQAFVSLEIAAFQLLNTKKFHPNIATILNLAPDHLDVFESVDAYYQAKWKIVENMQKDDVFILNIDDQQTMQTKPTINATIKTVSLLQHADAMIKDNQLMIDQQPFFNIHDLKIIGKHNIFNALVASTMARHFGVSFEHIAHVLSTFKGVEHRLEYVETIDEVAYYNDSKATNPPSTCIALDAFDQPIILLAGGYDKHTGFEQLLTRKDKIKHLIVFGQTKTQLKQLFDDAIVVDDLAQAVTQAKAVASKDDIICLSPACASYDQFKNFEHRGQVFKELVTKLKK